VEDCASPRHSSVAAGALWFALAAAPLAGSAGTWQPLTHQPAFPDIVDPGTNTDYSPGGAVSPMLLTDGSVLVLNTNLSNPDYAFANGQVFKLTPDINGSYVNGTWSQLASLPYIPFAGAQAVLPDGRVIVQGGEFTGYTGNFTLTNQGAIYDPLADSWTDLPPPPFFDDLYATRATFAPHPIGDSANVILPDGTYMLADKMSRQAALLDLQTLTWTETGTATKSDLNDEEGLTLLPNGTVLTIDCYTDYAFGLTPAYPADPTHSEIYDPFTGTWSSGGSTINTLTDPVLFETGPAVLRPDGTVFALGSQGYSSIFDTADGTWTAGPRLPISPQGQQYVVQDGPGALLPNGNVLIAADGGAPNPNLGNYSDPPTGFFEFDGQNFVAEPGTPNATTPTGYAFNVGLLVLPTGQVLQTDGTGDVEIYTPDDRSYDPAWAPVISSAPPAVVPGFSYLVYGVRFNGMSQASVFGDEAQNATNYPIVRITNLASGHVFYSRTHDHSSMAVAASFPVSTHFDVPAAQEFGPSTIEVVTNGIPSAPLAIDVVADTIFANGFEPLTP
jgi:hypothetical protein